MGELNTEKDVRVTAQLLMDTFNGPLVDFCCTNMACTDLPKIMCCQCPLNNVPFENYNNIRGFVLGLK